MVNKKVTKDTNQGEEIPEIMINMIKLHRESDILKYDDSTRNTRAIIDKVVHARGISKKAPVAKLDRDPKTYKEAMCSPMAERWL